jgi:hypothetical protein
VVVDGVRGAPRPTQISSIVQVFEGTKTLTESLYLLPGEPTPHWGIPPITWERRRHRWLGVGAGVASGLTAALYAGVLVQRQLYFDYSTPRTEADLGVLRTRINGANIAGIGTGLVAAGLGAALVWTW